MSFGNAKLCILYIYIYIYIYMIVYHKITAKYKFETETSSITAEFLNFKIKNQNSMTFLDFPGRGLYDVAARTTSPDTTTGFNVKCMVGLQR